MTGRLNCGAGHGWRRRPIFKTRSMAGVGVHVSPETDAALGHINLSEAPWHTHTKKYSWILRTHSSALNIHTTLTLHIPFASLTTFLISPWTPFELNQAARGSTENTHGCLPYQYVAYWQNTAKCPQTFCCILSYRWNKEHTWWKPSSCCLTADSHSSADKNPYSFSTTCFTLHDAQWLMASLYPRLLKHLNYLNTQYTDWKTLLEE